MKGPHGSGTFAAMVSRLEAILLLGGDLGDVGPTLARATGSIAERGGRVLAISRDHWTRPWGFQGEGLFLNRALRILPGRSPEELLSVLLDIEQELGRIRSGQGYRSRTVDIDILLWGDRVLHLPQLEIPHPRMHLRRFALAPVADVAPWAVHPVLGRTVLQLLDDLRDLPNT